MRALLGKVVLVGGLWFSLLGIFFAILFWLGATNLSDAEFKTLMIRMLQELTGYFNSIKKTQAEMKVTPSEIKKNLQGTSSGVHKAKN